MALSTAERVGSPRQQERRRRIIATAISLLSDREYERIQMRDVAEQADVALGTLYRYFPSKEQLFAAALVEWSETFESSVQRRFPSGGTDAERLAFTLRRAIAAFERFPHFFRVISLLDGVPDAAVSEPYSAYTGRFRQVVRSSLSNSADADTIASLAEAQLFTLLRAWSMGRLSMADVYGAIERSVDVLTRGRR